MMKPNIAAQLGSQMGMGRPGGMTSKVSTPVMGGTPGKGFAALENALLKGPKPNPKKLAKGKAGRQFFNQAAGGDETDNTMKVPGTVTSNPSALNMAQQRTGTPYGKITR